MRRLITSLLGLLAACMGGLILIRNVRPIHRFQMSLTEWSFVPGILGLLALLRGIRQGQFNAVFFGGFGLGAALWPWFWFLPTLIDMEEAMQRGLGSNYKLAIPPSMWSRVAPYHWSLLNTLGRRNFRPRATVIRDKVYGQPGIRPLKLDIYRPQIPPGEGSQYPAIIALHPGSWRGGDKGGWFAPHHRYLASQGYVVFDIQYRLSQEATWPAQLNDVRCAVAWVRQHAVDYQVNPDRIALMGRSAGGQLALRAAYDPDSNMNLKAVIALYAPTDMRLWASAWDTYVTELLGGPARDLPEVYADASPVECVRDDLPPTLLVQGLIDSTVQVAHAEALANRLEASNTPVVLLRIPWGRHGFDGFMPGLGAQAIQYNIDRFLAWSMFRDE